MIGFKIKGEETVDSYSGEGKKGGAVNNQRTKYLPGGVSPSTLDTCLRPLCPISLQPTPAPTGLLLHQFTHSSKLDVAGSLYLV